MYVYIHSTCVSDCSTGIDFLGGMDYEFFFLCTSLCVKDEHLPVAAEVEVKTRADDSSVQQETAM